MTPRPRTPQQRDKRFARVRRITQTVLIGSGVGSGLFVGYAASIAKPLTTIPATTVASGTPAGATTSTPTTATVRPATTAASHATTPVTSRATTPASTPATVPATAPATVPTTAPVTATTTCYSTPSGTRVCY